MSTDQRHSLHWLAMEFRKAKLNDEEGLLDALRNGRLTAAVEYPKAWPQIREVSTTYWKSLDRDEFIEIDKLIRQKDHDSEFTIKDEEFFDEEIAKIELIAEAIAQQNTTRIPQSLEQEVLKRCAQINFDNFQDWGKLLKTYVTMRDILYEDSNLHVFVTDENWRHYSSQNIKNSESIPRPRNSGAPRKTSWDLVYAQVIRMICQNSEKNLRELTNSRSMKEMSGKILNALKIENDQHLPDEDTIRRDLKKLSEQ